MAGTNHDLEEHVQRITVTLDDDRVAELDEIIRTRGYQNRSEAIRDLTRSGLKEAILDASGAEDCVAAVVYVFDHSARDLSKRLVGTFHDNHQLVLSTLHVHLDHDHCMEATVLKGKSAQVQAVANQIISERGVRHGRLIMIPAELEAEMHDHDGETPHSHIKIK